tara:strand:- start:2691 stop:2942 length:252 start_codon:yes stop_codon:yes gene_type:complete
MDTVKDVYGEYYEAKAREIPRQSSLSPEAKILWQRMEDMAWSVTYSNGSSKDLEEAVLALSEHPGCTWKESTLWYYLRQMYWK